MQHSNQEQHASSLPIKTVGIIGAGKVGIVLAQLSLKAGYDVLISGSGEAAKIALSVKILAPGAHAVNTAELAKKADIIILAIPLSKYKTIPAEILAGKVVIDSMNHWYEVDGPREETIPNDVSSSEAVQRYLRDSRVIKALSHMGYHELFDNPYPRGDDKRKAIAVAGSQADAEIVTQLIDSIGFDSLYIGELSEGSKLEPGMAAFGANLSKDNLEKILNT